MSVRTAHWTTWLGEAVMSNKRSDDTGVKLPALVDHAAK